ncbi:MAG TPA: deoxyribodipyrimidine photo-lyase [Flavitalea sp.]|nr:deoxyribodipyrimidine photo-lyase [Flavitalea sp.]
MKEKIAICWFRRDLRIEDNAALFHALKENEKVLPLFIFDRNILDQLEDPSDGRVAFIHAAVTNLNHALHEHQSSIAVYFGFPLKIFRELMETFEISGVYANHDYEPYARERDGEVAGLLQQQAIPFRTYKDQVIFEKNEIVKDDGKPYTVFTPYCNKWKSRLNIEFLRAYRVDKYLSNLYRRENFPMPSLAFIGFQQPALSFPSKIADELLVKKYHRTRDFPGLEGTSRMGIHLRFGTISIRALAKRARELNDTFLNELIWREFYQMILYHFPEVGKGKSFKPAYDAIQWRNNETEFKLWCSGNTGYPLVDAGMRELNQTGFMHNRVRMVTASFLCKHLLIDWRWGEAYFASKLLDFDLASNNGGWQWASGSGCDAAPYFRIFNPSLQLKKFDPSFTYVRRWVPEFETFDYARPIVEHGFARKRCLEVYSKAVQLVSH